MMTDDIYIEYTADDEMPNCGRCDNVCGEYFKCEEWCGAEHGWFGYRRTDVLSSYHKKDDMKNDKFK